MNRIIAVSGWKGSGKDTVAEHLQLRHNFDRYSFAEALKFYVSDEYGISREWLDDRVMKEEPLLQYPVIPGDPTSHKLHSLFSDSLSSGYWTPRALCILEGAIKRAVHPNYWVNKVVEGIKESLSEGTSVVISDMRFKSEADTLRLLLPGVQFIRVMRFDSVGTNDPSERDLDDYTKFDYTINNRGTKDELYEVIDNIATGHKPF